MENCQVENGEPNNVVNHIQIVLVCLHGIGMFTWYWLDSQWIPVATIEEESIIRFITPTAAVWFLQKKLVQIQNIQ